MALDQFQYQRKLTAHLNEIVVDALLFHCELNVDVHDSKLIDASVSEFRMKLIEHGSTP